ncbi:MAG: PDZ domain-containing protein, partial [Saprospiraceae bacterium]|nr:PDZ domain-containing protein [Saprospiraceae bacterium]
MSKIIQYILAILGVFLVTFAAKAGDESYVNSLKGDEIRVGNSNVTEDIWYTYMQNNNDWENVSATASKQSPFARDKRFSNYDANAYVSLRWEGTDAVRFNEKWYYKVTVLVKGWDADGNQIGNEQRTLNIDYNPEHVSSFKDWDALRLPNIHRVEVTIRKIEFSNDGVNYVSQGVVGNKFEDLYLETKVEVERYFSLDLEESLGVWRQNINTVDRTVTYAWDYLEGAELYDFEWVYVFSEAHLEGTGTPDIDWDRATRVTLENNHYSLELPYEEGYVYVRVRAVSYANPAHQRIMTDWEYEEILRILETGGDITPFESDAVGATDKNWSYQAQYAEHGKRSEVISFFDGTGRLRQTITKDNSTGNVLVAETVFDYEGREAISISPSPSGSHQMKFYQNYNLNTASPAKPFSAVDFDKDDNYYNPSNPTATVIASPLSTSSGSSQYFSSNNPAANSGNMAYVPDADGYPYARTTIDNQGRIKTQAGAGEHYKKGSGHETEFYYGSVFQEDLDQLFGAEVGYAEHYRMKAVKDANGQLSVTYENLAGQTIATSLVGGAPNDDQNNPMLEDLDPNNDNYNYDKTRDHTVGLTPYNRVEVDADGIPEWVIHRELAFISDGDYNFTYTFDPSQYTGCGNGDCNYEVLFYLLNDEGNELPLSDSDPYVSYTLPNGLPGTLDEPFALGAIGQTQISFTLKIGAGFLEQGSYILEKRLRLINIDEQVADFEEQLRDELSIYMLDPSNSNLSLIGNGSNYCLDPSVVVNEVVSSIDLECYTEDGNQTTIPDLLDPNGDVSPGGVTCDVYRQLLLNDVSPGGGADDAGIVRGDIILSINDYEVNDVSALQEV